MDSERITTRFGAQSTAAEVIAGIDLTGRRAIVTGGASGIGVETARALAGANAEVTLAVRNLEAGERTAAPDHEVEAIVETEQARIGIHIGGAIAAAAGAAQINCTVDVARGEARIRNRKTRGFRGNHALRPVGLLPCDDAETDDRILPGRWMFRHLSSFASALV